MSNSADQWTSLRVGLKLSWQVLGRRRAGRSDATKVRTFKGILKLSNVHDYSFFIDTPLNLSYPR